ncbi:MAG: hypothetical protein O9972_39600 [Burkholderiales bacterium]|nr:hypothetical protein [Burkholderiales bacterium]
MSPAEAEILLELIESDPCVAARRLRALQLSMDTTGAVQKISFRDRDLWFQPVKDSGTLANLIAQADAACAAKSGKVSNFAITLGGGRRRGPTGTL